MKTKKNHGKKSKGGGIGTSRVKREEHKEPIKNKSLKKRVVFDSAENEYYSDVSRDSDEMIRSVKKDKIMAYLEEAEELNDDIREKNHKRELTNEKNRTKGNKKEKKMLKLVDPIKYAQQKQEDMIKKQRDRKKTLKNIRQRENTPYLAAAERKRRAEEFDKHMKEFMENKHE